MYQSITSGISVSVEPFFLKRQRSNLFIWAYRVIIENQSDFTILINSRYWSVIDVCGDSREVIGDGVIGECPQILPGNSYEYMSGIPLINSAGIMMGKYNIITSGGETFDVLIPPFLLDSPFHVRILN